MFVLVRHAHAGSKRRWPGPDDERPLSRRGQRQAAEVARLLRHLGVTRLLSSPTVRCRQSLAAASDLLWLPIEPVQELSVAASPDDLLQLLASPRVDGSALCTHKETLRTLSRAWASSSWAGSGAAPPDLSRTPKAASWVVEDYLGPRARARQITGNGGASKP